MVEGYNRVLGVGEGRVCGVFFVIGLVEFLDLLI